MTENIKKEFTPYQIEFLTKVLLRYKKLRKSHFYTCEGGMKREKIGWELILTETLIEYLNADPD